MSRLARLRLRRRLQQAALVLLLPAALAAWVVGWWLPGWAEERAQAALRQAGCDPAEIELSALSPWFAQIARLRVGHSDLTLGANGLTADFRPWEAARGRLRHVSIDDLRLEWSGAATAAPSDPEVPRESGAAALACPVLPLETLEVRAGVLGWTGAGGSVEMPFTLEARHTGEDRWEASAGQADGNLTWAVEVRADPRANRASGQVHWVAENPLALSALAPPGLLPDLSAWEIQAGPLRGEGLVEWSEGAPGGWTALFDSQAWSARWSGIELQLGRVVAGMAGQGVQLSTARVAAKGWQAAWAGGRAGPGAAEGEWRPDGSWHWRVPEVSAEMTGGPRARLALEVTTGDPRGWPALPLAGRLEVRELALGDLRLAPFAVDFSGQPDDFRAQAGAVDMPAWVGGRLESCEVRLRDLTSRPRVESSAVFHLRPSWPGTGAELSLEAQGALAPADPGGWQGEVQVTNREPTWSWDGPGWSTRAEGGFSTRAEGSADGLTGTLEWALRRLTAQWDGGVWEVENASGEARTTRRTLSQWQETAARLPSTPDAWGPWLEKALRSAQGEIGRLRGPGGLSLEGLAIRLAESPETPGQGRWSWSVAAGGYGPWRVNSTRGQLEYAAGAWHGELLGELADPVCPVRLSGSATGLDQARFALQAGPAELAGARRPAGFAPEWPDFSLSGGVALEVDGEISGAGSRLSAKLTLDGASLELPAQEARLLGVAGTVRLDTLQPLQTAGLQELRVERVEASGQALTDLLVQFEVTGDDVLKVSRAEFTWEGARFHLAPMRTPLSRPQFTLAFAVVGLELERLTRLLPEWDLRARGLVDGILALRFDGSEFQPAPGYLELRPGTQGWVSYARRGWLAAPLPEKPSRAEIEANRTARSVESALANLTVTELRLDFHNPGAELKPVRITLAGEGHDDEVLQTVVPVGGITINVDLPIQELLELPLLQGLRLRSE